jgi:hypothetical protein
MPVKPRLAQPATRRAAYPVTVTRLPVVRCAECQQTMAHQPGQVGEVLTDHYVKAGHVSQPT